VCMCECVIGIVCVWLLFCAYLLFVVVVLINSFVPLLCSKIQHPTYCYIAIHFLHTYVRSQTDRRLDYIHYVSHLHIYIHTYMHTHGHAVHTSIHPYIHTDTHVRTVYAFMSIKHTHSMLNRHVPAFHTDTEVGHP